mmetsp:Transcript_3611/g.8890  ORF Transcript_3611/g.8890 Transcript_3611/m.8890 type:complete len:352 (-) Transcript_3611:1583-2638(-)
MATAAQVSSGMGSKPGPHHLPIALKPGGVHSDRLERLLQRHLCTWSLLVGKERFYLHSSLLRGKGADGCLDDASKRRLTGGKHARDLAPVLLQEAPGNIHSQPVRSEASKHVEDVLGSDRAVESHRQHLLHQRLVLRRAQCAHGSVSLVRHLRLLEHSLHLLELFASPRPHHCPVHRVPQVCWDRLPPTAHAPPRLGCDLLVAVPPEVEDHERAQHGEESGFTGLRLPPDLAHHLVQQLHQHLLQLLVLRLLGPRAHHVRERPQQVCPHCEVLLLLELHRQCQRLVRPHLPSSSQRKRVRLHPQPVSGGEAELADSRAEESEQGVVVADAEEGGLVEVGLNPSALLLLLHF